ncbi:MAG TPA: helix-turn-helix domain-containing protein [Baekduia sp.]
MSSAGAAPERVLHAEPEEQSGLAEVLSLLDRLESRGERKTRLVGPDGDAIELPASAFEALRAVVSGMANGQTITLVPHGQELTTQQAADILNVSRPHVIKLLESGEIAHHKVGSHRRVNVEDVLRYRADRAKARRAQLEELTRLSEELGYE